VIYLYVNKSYKTVGMAIDLADDNPDAGPIALGVNTSNKLGIVEGAKILTDGHVYDDVMDVYEDVCQDVFDLDYYHIGNYLRDSFFENMVSAHTIIATVDIKPWTAYVTIPDVPDIIVDPRPPVWAASSCWRIVNPVACSLLRPRLLKNEKSSSNRLLPRHGSATMH
jgi:hypothetical protein